MGGGGGCESETLVKAKGGRWVGRVDVRCQIPPSGGQSGPIHPLTIFIHELFLRISGRKSGSIQAEFTQ
jgi:hypothetical protein